jgi:hypothetical protein
MSDFISSLKYSVKIFSSEPKLLIPKLVIAAIFTVIMVATVHYYVLAIENYDISVIPVLLMLFFVTLLANVLDILASAMYPYLVDDFRKNKKVSLMDAFKKAVKNSFKIVVPVAAIELAFIVITSVFAIVLMFILPNKIFNIVSAAFYLLTVIAFVFVFYNIYSVIAFEKHSIVDSIRRTVRISIRNKAVISKATILTTFLSLISFALAYYLEVSNIGQDIMFWVAFVIIRILTAYIYSYIYILNPVVYFQLSSK